MVREDKSFHHHSIGHITLCQDDSHHCETVWTQISRPDFPGEVPWVMREQSLKTWLLCTFQALHPVSFTRPCTIVGVLKDLAGRQVRDLLCLETNSFPLAANPSSIGALGEWVNRRMDQWKNWHFPWQDSPLSPGDCWRVDKICIWRIKTPCPETRMRSSWAVWLLRANIDSRQSKHQHCSLVLRSKSLIIHEQGRHPSHSKTALTLDKFIHPHICVANWTCKCNGVWMLALETSLPRQRSHDTMY